MWQFKYLIGQFYGYKEYKPCVRMVSGTDVDVVNFNIGSGAGAYL